MKKILSTLLVAAMLLSLVIVAAVPAAAVDGEWAVYGPASQYVDGYDGDPKSVSGYEYTDDGFHTIPADWEGAGKQTPWVQVETKEKVNLKDGVFFQIRVDAFSYDAADQWFNINVWDQGQMEPPVAGFGEGVQNLIRGNSSGKVSGISWYIENFTSKGSSSMTAEKNLQTEDGKVLLDVTITWDGSTYAYNINGAAAPQAVIDYMNTKWGGADSEAYVGICAQNSKAGGTVELTVTKFGTSAEDATVPMGDDSKEPITEYHVIADIADPNTVEAGQPAIFMNGSRDNSDSKSNHGITAGGDSKRNDDFSVRYTADRASYYTQYSVANDVSYDAKDFPVALVLTRDYCTCEDPADCYALESVSTYICNGEVTGADEQHRITELSMCDSPLVKDGRSYLYFYADLENDAGFDYEGRINSIRFDFGGILFDQPGRNAFDIVFIAYFRSVEEAEQYVIDYLGITETEAPETEAPTEEATEVVTEAPEATTEAKADATEAPAGNETDAPAKKSGCGSVVGFGAIAIVAVAAAAGMVSFKKKD